MVESLAKKKRFVNDSELVEAAKKGDPRSARELFDRFSELVWRVVYRLVLNSEDCRDVCQETWLRAFRALPQFREESRFETWLVRIAINTAKSSIRKGRFVLLPYHEDESGELELVVPKLPEQRSRLNRKRQQVEIERALRKLTSSQRQVFVLRHFENWPLSRIAEALGRREGTIKSHLFRATRRLEKELKHLIDEEGDPK